MEIDDEIKVCSACILHKTRVNAVPGAGSRTARIMFIGEAPGANEDKTGVPFVGRAGHILDELLASINLSREDIYITNIVKCRPPGNRDPTPEEIQTCSPYLDRQIQKINPQVIVPLGRFAAEYIMTKYKLEKEKISSAHGKKFKVNLLLGRLTIVPMYHPAVVAYNPNLKEVLLEDFKSLSSDTI